MFCSHLVSLHSGGTLKFFLFHCINLVQFFYCFNHVQAKYSDACRSDLCYFLLNHLIACFGTFVAPEATPSTPKDCS